MDKLKNKEILQFEGFKELCSQIKWFDNFNMFYCKKGLFEKEQSLKNINFNFLKNILETLFGQYSIKGTIFKNSESKRIEERSLDSGYFLFVNADVGTTKFVKRIYPALNEFDLTLINLHYPALAEKIYSLKISGEKRIFYPNHPSIFIKYKDELPIFF